MQDALGAGCRFDHEPRPHRDRAAEIGLPTARYGYAENLQQMLDVYHALDSKVVVKPVMSSSGKGQSLLTPTIQ